MQLNHLTTNSGSTKKRRVGRGGVRGKTSGRGTKGQKSRAGRKFRPEERDIIKRIPKRRGYGKNRGRTVNQGRADAVAISLALLERTFEAGARVTPRSLVDNGCAVARGGKLPRIKIVATGALTKKLTIAGCELSGASKTAIEGAGGVVV